MQPATELQYLGPANPTCYPSHFTMIEKNMSNLNISRFLSPLPNALIPPPPLAHEFSTLSGLSNNSTSDEAEEEHQLSIIDERKQRRMISNRESARRSRMRKQRHLDELRSQVVRFRTQNRQLIDKLNHTSKHHDQILQENVQLREEASKLRQILSDLQLDNPYIHSLRDMEEVP